MPCQLRLQFGRAKHQTPPMHDRYARTWIVRHVEYRKDRRGQPRLAVVGLRHFPAILLDQTCTDNPVPLTCNAIHAARIRATQTPIPTESKIVSAATTYNMPVTIKPDWGARPLAPTDRHFPRLTPASCVSPLYLRMTYARNRCHRKILYSESSSRYSCDSCAVAGAMGTTTSLLLTRWWSYTQVFIGKAFAQTFRQQWGI